MSRRANANLHFISLRDASGAVQVVCRHAGFAAEMASLPLESVVQIKGTVKARTQKRDGAVGTGVRLLIPL